MKKLMFMIATGIVAASCFRSLDPPIGVSSNPVTTPTPNPNLSTFDERARRNGFEPLKAKSLGEGIEIRLWVNGGLASPRGVFLTKRKTEWNAVYLPPISQRNEDTLALDLSDRFAAWDDLSNQIKKFILKDQPLEKQTRFLDAQLILLEYQEGQNEKVVISLEEPCAQKSAIGEFLCSVVKDVQSNLQIQLMRLPDE